MKLKTINFSLNINKQSCQSVRTFEIFIEEMSHSWIVSFLIKFFNHDDVDRWYYFLFLYTTIVFCHADRHFSQSFDFILRNNDERSNRTRRRSKSRSERNVCRRFRWSIERFVWKENVRRGPFIINLIFHHDDQFRVTGNGTDDVGNFNVNGFYSIKMLRLAFRKDYSVVVNNFIRSSMIQTRWMFDADQFEESSSKIFDFDSTNEFFTIQHQWITIEHEDLI